MIMRTKRRGKKSVSTHSLFTKQLETKVTNLEHARITYTLRTIYPPRSINLKILSFQPGQLTVRNSLLKQRLLT